jgi:hypothetical protein
MMKSKITAALTALLIALPCAVYCAQDDENITDVQEQKSYVKGGYAAGAEGDTLTVKKGEGFDFKIPEILITGQIDTKVLLKRETTSLDDLQSIKNVLFEQDKISMPYSYLREEELAPQNEEKLAAKDLAGKIKLLGGTYGNFLLDGTLGKAFDDSNSALLRIIHNNVDNEIINDRLTYRNTNNVECFYNTRYSPFEAKYYLNGEFDQYSNPYPSNAFGNFYNMQDYSAGLDLNGDINGYGADISLKYGYFDEKNNSGLFLYKENRLELKTVTEKDFALEQEKKIKTILSAGGYYSEVHIGPASYNNVFSVDVLFKGIFYFEPVVFQGGFRLQDYNMHANYFRMSPYLSVNYDMFPAVSLYADFKPQMQVTDNTGLLKTPFTAASTGYAMPVEDTDLKTGVNFSLFEAFVDIYYGYKSIRNNVYLDASEGSGPGDYIFSYRNNDIDYSFAGISLETLKTGNIKIKLDYEYISIIDQSATTTYMPDNTLDAKIVYQPAEWEFTLGAALKTSQYGASSVREPPLASVNLSVSRKITDNFIVTGFINNLLNNNYYLLYYYKEKMLNLGLALTLKF